VSRNCSGGIATYYGLDHWKIAVRFPAKAGNFSIRHRVQTGSGAHPASYPIGTVGSFLGGKTAGAWSWQLTSISCRGERMRGAIPPPPNTSSCRGAELSTGTTSPSSFNLLAWNKIHWLALMFMVMNLQVPRKEGISGLAERLSAP
jgi:hypothetical protein